jgi:hypothetical protein
VQGTVSADDHRLIAACLQGDAAAFGELVRRYQDRLYNSVFRLLGNAGRRLRLQPGGRGAQRVLQRLLQVDVAAAGGVAAHGLGQLVGQDLPQPGGELGLGLSAELVALLVGAKQRLLDEGSEGSTLACSPGSSCSRASTRRYSR